MRIISRIYPFKLLSTSFQSQTFTGFHFDSFAKAFQTPLQKSGQKNSLFQLVEMIGDIGKQTLIEMNIEYKNYQPTSGILS